MKIGVMLLLLGALFLPLIYPSPHLCFIVTVNWFPRFMSRIKTSKPKLTNIYREPIVLDYPISDKLKNCFKVESRIDQRNKSRLWEKTAAEIREINREDSEGGACMVGRLMFARPSLGTFLVTFGVCQKSLARPATEGKSKK